MSAYRIYYVTTGRPKAGKIEAAGRWWAEVGLKSFEAMPGTKSVRAYITQFGLGAGEFPLEIWQELQSYAAFDEMDKGAEFDIAAYTNFQTDFNKYYDLGPCRIMGEWPASRPGIAPS